jgi:hypothetical protein
MDRPLCAPFESGNYNSGKKSGKNRKSKAGEEKIFYML